MGSIFWNMLPEGPSWVWQVGGTGVGFWLMDYEPSDPCPPPCKAWRTMALLRNWWVAKLHRGPAHPVCCPHPNGSVHSSGLWSSLNTTERPLHL